MRHNRVTSRTMVRTVRGWGIGPGGGVTGNFYVAARPRGGNRGAVVRGFRPGRRGVRRALALAALAATTMLVAACGGNGPPGVTGSTQYQKALAFTNCMRSHGALGFPDPSSQGTFTVTQALLKDPQIRSAAPSCQNLAPPPSALQVPAALQRKLESQALQYAACMRSHGVPNFPDPMIQNGLPEFRVAAPQFQAPRRACQRLLPGSR
jgi:hypothetical protein